MTDGLLAAVIERYKFPLLMCKLYCSPVRGHDPRCKDGWTDVSDM